MKLNLDLRGVETVYQLNLVKRLFAGLEAQLADAQKRTIEELQCEFTLDSEDAYEEMRSIVNGQDNHHEAEVQALRAAELVRLYMLLEQELKSFCSAVKSRKGLALEWKDFDGSFVEKARKFLCRYLQLLDSGNAIWRDLDDFRIVRVHLVHGTDDQSDKTSLNAIKRLAKRLPNLGLMDGPEFVLARSTCDHFHEMVKQLFATLFDAVGWKAFRQTGSILVDDTEEQVAEKR